MMARNAEIIEAELQQVHEAMMQTSAFSQSDEWRRLLQRRQWLQIELEQAERPVYKQKTDIRFIYPKTIVRNI